MAGWKRGYQEYRDCLRWDFGFTCPFCLLHESDVGSSHWTTEHLDLVSEDTGRDNDYSNCLYCCRWCNRARSDKPRKSGHKNLLDPTTVAWANHFSNSGDNLIPIASDDDATYTHEAYDIDDPRKVAKRRDRRELMESHLGILRDWPRSVAELNQVAETLPGTDALKLLLAAKRMRQGILSAAKDLRRFAAVPENAPETCRCGHRNQHFLPPQIEEQLLLIDL